jgi:hypothetical protein
LSEKPTSVGQAVRFELPCPKTIYKQITKSSCCRIPEITICHP